MRKLILTLLAILTLGFASAQSFEVGYELDPRFGSAPFIYVTDDYHLGGAFGADLWLSPSAELELRDPIEGFVQLQALVDTAPFTLSARARYQSTRHGDDVTVRVGLLFDL